MPQPAPVPLRTLFRRSVGLAPVLLSPLLAFVVQFSASGNQAPSPSSASPAEPSPESPAPSASASDASSPPAPLPLGAIEATPVLAPDAGAALAPRQDPDEVAPPSEVAPALVAPAAPLGTAAEPMTVQEVASAEVSAPRPRPFPALASLNGPLGLLHASIAEVGAPRQLRLGLHGEFFSASDFLVRGDSNQRLAGSLVVGYTPRRDLELFGAFLNSTNRNQRDRAPEDRDPEIIKTFGDLILGAKWILPLSSAATVGAELGLKFLSGVSDLALSPGSTSWWFGPLFTYDLRRSADLPLRFHAAASFYADNSSNLDHFSGASRATKEAAMFGYGIAASRLRASLAVDAPLDRLFPRVPIVPFVEYHLAYVTADADRDFRDYMAPNCNSSNPSRIATMPCIDNRDLQFFTLGARAAVYRGLTVDLGVDIRVRSPGFPYGPPLPPYNVIFGLSYPLDLDSLTRPVVLTRVVEPPAPPSQPSAAWKTEGYIEGTVRSAVSETPVAGAMVSVIGRARARAASDADGGFATPHLPGGIVELEVTAPDFVPSRSRATVRAGEPTEVVVHLVPVPALGKVHGRVTDSGGRGLDGSLKFLGNEVLELKTDGSGAFSSGLPAGPYQVRVEAAGFAPRLSQVETLAGQDKQLDFVLNAVALHPDITLEGDRINVKQSIRFVGATATLTPASEKLLDGVAELLDARKEIERVNIIAHWDSGLGKPQALELTRAQAASVRSYLVARGVDASRLEASGEGASRPVVPNLTPANRSRNRRVEFRLEGAPRSPPIGQ